jgi:hypothetical protein
MTQFPYSFIFYYSDLILVYSVVEYKSKFNFSKNYYLFHLLSDLIIMISQDIFNFILYIFSLFLKLIGETFNAI